MSIVERHGLWTPAQWNAAAEVERRIRDAKVEVLRLCFADQHGVLRGKTVVASDIDTVLRDGCGCSSTLLLKDTSHQTVYQVFGSGERQYLPEFHGAADILLIPDPTTFQVLPWAPHTGWLLCDLHFSDGRPVPLCSRGIYRRALAELAQAGYEFMAGLEVEFHLLKIENPRLQVADAASPGRPGEPPDVSLLTQGYQYLTESRYDQLDGTFEILRRNLQQLGLPLRSLEVEFGPSQVEFTFDPRIGLSPADNMILFRSAVKQICRRHGYHASFMCRPRLPNVMSSGWHLHQSLRAVETGANAFVPSHEGALSEVGQHYLAGLLEHACAAATFSTPTINGYKRYRPNSLAPDRAIWGRDNRGVMVRVLGGPGNAATRLENRVGEPAANPYLYMASQVLSGLDGISRKLTPPPSADSPYETPAKFLPRSLDEALRALRASTYLREKLGATFLDCYLHIKQAELRRFELEVSEWEQREYFDLF